jgi:transposase
MLPDRPVPGSDVPSAAADSPFIYGVLIPEDHLLRRIRDNVDFSFAHDLVSHHYCLDNGRPGIAPELLLRISFLQYLFNLSDREAIEGCRQRLDFKFFLGMAVESPAPCDASTLSRVRTRWGEETFKLFFEGTVEQARAKNLLGGRRAVDSSKMLMNATVQRASALLRRLCGRLIGSLRELRKAGDETYAHLAAEGVSLREDTSWFLSDELKEKRLMRWGEHADEILSYVLALFEAVDAGKVGAGPKQVKALAEVRTLSALLAKHVGIEALENQLKSQPLKKKEGGAPDKPNPVRKDKLVSDVDPDARNAADHKHKVKAGYKAHVSMDSDSEIVTAVQITPMNREDGPFLPELIADECRRGLQIEEVAADAAYSDGAVREMLADNCITTYIPEPAPKPSAEGKYISSDFDFNPLAMTLTCPGAREASSVTHKQERHLFYFNREGCASCALNAACLSQKELVEGVKHGRTVSVSRYRPLHDAARAAQASSEHKNAMNRRLAVEHKQAEMLNQRGLRNARYRGRSKVAIQGYLTAAATNIRRMAVLCLQEEKTSRLEASAA